MAEGKGPSLGAALLDLAAAHGGRKSTYRAQGWHARLRALTGTERGLSFADQAGLSPSRRTLLAWLAEEQHPNSENRRKIDEAYEAAARKAFPESMKTGTIEITGQVDDGTGRVRDRGAGGRAPFRVDAGAGDWDAIEEAWENGTLDAELFEELFTVDVLEEDIGDGSGGGWSFPGPSYSCAQ